LIVIVRILKGNIMEESKFTPGPLSVEENNWQDDPWGVVAGDTCIGVAIETGVEGETKANAELMADAPRLLEVLRKVLTYSEPLSGWQHIDEAEQAFGDANDLLEKHGG
jgi:hypothetical protein